MPSPVSSASARLAVFLVPGEPSAMSSRSSAAPSLVRLRTAPSTSTSEMNFSVSSMASRWPPTSGIAMQLAASSSARNGSPDATALHSWDSTSRTIASASPGASPSEEALPEGALPEGALPEGALLDAPLRRGRVFLLTASYYGPPQVLDNG